MREMSYNFNECNYHSKQERRNKLLRKRAHYFTLLFSFLHFNREIETICAPYLQRFDSLSMLEKWTNKRMHFAKISLQIGVILEIGSTKPKIRFQRNLSLNL